MEYIKNANILYLDKFDILPNGTVITKHRKKLYESDLVFLVREDGSVNLIKDRTAVLLKARNKKRKLRRKNDDIS